MPDPLAVLRKITEQRRQGDAEYRAALHAAVKAGHTQTAIAQALGVSRQAVQQQLRRGKGTA